MRFDDAPVVAAGLTLRLPTTADIPAIAEACSDEQVQRWIPLPRPYTVESARAFVEDHAAHLNERGGGIEHAIEVDGRFAGAIGVTVVNAAVREVEVGYWLAPWARGRGVAVRALAALTDWLLDSQGVQRVDVRVATGNTASLAVARRAGFVEEGTLRRTGTTHDGVVDLVVFSRLLDDPRPSIQAFSAR